MREILKNYFHSCERKAHGFTADEAGRLFRGNPPEPDGEDAGRGSGDGSAFLIIGGGNPESHDHLPGAFPEFRKDGDRS